ncbi:hypothetical protein [Nocardioides okcheonensis]|uniref:hypothetical protein n=1 Tax=Nocardioides okcheonensis TaxID=2894081 RepID=UPI001E2B0718|nr:hypothetical protein [Nocardioides okcheonensis]UFN44519.1 hypothetical protein LN652_21160 [Nocardioides okcheonensis]
MTADDATLALLSSLSEPGDGAAIPDVSPHEVLKDQPSADASAYALRLIRSAHEPAAPAVASPSSAPASAHAASEAPGVKVKPTTRLYKHFRTACDLIHCDGRAYAVPRETTELVGPAGVAIPLEPFRRIVTRVARRVPDVGGISQTMARDVVAELEADAYAGPASRVDLRIHHDPAAGRIVIDLARPDGLAIVVTAQGWTVEPIPMGVVFRRSHATLPLPDPVRGGRLDELAAILSLDPVGVPFASLSAWAVGTLFAASVRPAVLLWGPMGCGKTTALRVVASTVEPTPASAMGSAFGRNLDDDLVRATHRALPIWDNLQRVSGAVSEQFCSMVTGTAIEKRQLYTDTELVSVAVARPVGLTAVAKPAGFRPDALDRMTVVEMQPLPVRIADDAIQARFDEAHPRLLGALCDAAAAALRWMPYTPAPTHLRMAAHAHVLAAIDAATAAGELVGVPAGLLATYADLAGHTSRDTAAEDVFGGALLALLEESGGAWSGKASELLAAAGRHVMLGVHGAGWPGSPRKVPEALAYLRPGLAEIGVTWQRTTVRSKTRYSFATAPIAATDGVAL